MLSRREQGSQVSVRPQPLRGVFEKDAFVDPDFLGSAVGQRRRLLTLLQGVEASQQLLRRHTRQGLCCQDWNETALHFVERFRSVTRRH
jgi:hypothetical protein